MQHSTTTAPRVPNTVETVFRTDDDILLWVEDNQPSPCQWDAHAGAPSGEMATAQRQKEEKVYRRLAEEAQQMREELSEIDFMDAALADFRRNGHTVGLHEDPNDWRDTVPGYRAPYRL